MGRIWLTSDLHFNHNKEFIYKARGFDTIQDMNETIIKNFNEVVANDDDVYILGDLMLGQDLNDSLSYVRRLYGNLHVVYGNHDTNNRREAYNTLYNVVEVGDALTFKYGGYHFYCSHYPTYTGNLEKESLRRMTLNLYGHTHQQTNFYNEIPFMYHVGVDSHNCTPVLIDDIIEEMNNKVEDCKEWL